MAKLTILSGEPHSGKTQALLDRLQQHIERGERAILLVPEQATYRAESALSERFGGLLGVDVFSFDRLCERLISECGRDLPYLDDRGRCMVLRRAAFLGRERLQLFSRASERKGFAAAMDARIGRFKQSCITPDDLDAAARQLPEYDLLRQKLEDFSLLYRESESFLAARYLTANDLMTVAETLVADSRLKDCDVYVDDFSRPREQSFRLLLRILHTAKSVTITLRDSADPALADLYSPDRKLRERLASVCAAEGIPFFEQYLAGASPAAPALDHLLSNLFSLRPRAWTGPSGAVSFLACKDRATEVALTADRILELVKSGRRFSEIAVVTSDLAAYGPLVRRAFALRGIPLFYDATRPIGGLAAIDFIRSAARTVCLGFSIDDLLRLVKSGYAGVTDADAEVFENYVLRYGIYGSECRKPFEIGEIPPAAETVRAHLMETLLPLYEATAAPKTADRIRALWEYLKANRLKEQLEAEAQTLLSDGLDSDAQLIAQVWRAVTDLLVQLNTVLGETQLKRREFPMLLEEGLSGFSVGVLPGQGDRVTLGDLVRTRLEPVDTLFVLGCTDGAFLPVRTDDDLINDPELETMRGLGLPVWEGTQGESAADRLALISLLGKARRRIVFSRAFSDGASELNRSALLESIERLFPDVPETVGMTALTDAPMSKPVAFYALSELLSSWRQDGYCAPMLPALLACFSGDENYRAAASAILSGEAENVSPAPFGQDVAKALYGPAPSMSASRLEQFARCPFSQYLKYGLGAEERKTAEETASDAGTFLHDALDAFVKGVRERGLAWRSMTEADADSVLDAILPPLLVSHNDGLFSRDPRLKESLFLRLRTVRLAAYSILRQLRAGDFEVVETEMAFGMDGSPFSPVTLTLADGARVRVYGKIDRVDRTPDGKLLRIIDYKMGKSRTFDPSKLLSGESLQLPLYVCAAKQLGGDLAGMYYMPLTLDPPEPGEPKQHRLYGLTASDAETIAASGEFEKQSPLIHDLKRNKDGSITGAAAERERLEAIVFAARRIAARQAAGILAGNADIFPTASACKWCPYGSVCRFDKQTGCKTRYVRKVSLDDLLCGKEELP